MGRISFTKEKVNAIYCLLKGYCKDFFWPIFDQVVYSISNFAIGIFLANHLTLYDFGQFNIAWSTQTLLTVLHNSIVVDPMLVLGKTRFPNKIKSYYSSLTRFQTFGISIVGVLIGVILSIVYRWNALLLLAFLFSCLSGITLQFLRRFLYLQNKVNYASFGGIAYLIIVFGLFFIDKKGIDIEIAFFCITCGGLGGLLLNYYQIRKLIKNHNEEVSNKEIVIEHWNFGKWLLLSSALSWLPINIYAYILPMRINGIEEVGIWRALLNMIFPLQLILANFSVYLTVRFSERLSKGMKIDRLIINISIFYLFISICYAIVICLWGSKLLNYIYSGKYNDFAKILPIFSLIPIFSSFHSLLGAAAKAYNRANALTISSFWGVCATIVIVPIIMHWGIIITPICNSFAYFIMAIPMIIELKKLTGK